MQSGFADEVDFDPEVVEGRDLVSDAALALFQGLLSDEALTNGSVLRVLNGNLVL